MQEAGGPDGFDDEEEDNNEGDEMDMLYGENDEDEEFSDATEILQVLGGLPLRSFPDPGKNPNSTVGILKTLKLIN